MRRRWLLQLGSAVSIAGLTGCLGADPVATASPTPAQPSTPTQATGLGTIEYTVVNEDDVAHSLAVTMANVEGRIVQETNEPSLEPGASVSSGSAGEPPEGSPFELSFETEFASATYTWDLEECVRIDLLVTIEADGELRIERTLCRA